MTDFEEAILRVLMQISPGQVFTYGEVAEQAGYPGRARAVGRLLAETTEEVPWWRVVGAGGHLRAPSGEEQRALLSAEGHRVVGLKVDLS